MSMTDGETAIWREVFDFWRESYDHMPYAMHQRFYNMVARAFPDQDKADRDLVESALTHALVMHGHPLKVWELGGWDGALAKDMFEACGDGIERWYNIEICSAVATRGWPQMNYQPKSPPCWAWELGMVYGCDIAILSHVIEHLSWAHLKALLTMLSDVPLIYMQTPEALGYAPHPTAWMGTMSTHKLEVGMIDVDALLIRKGFFKLWYKDQSTFWGRVIGDAES